MRVAGRHPAVGLLSGDDAAPSPLAYEINARGDLDPSVFVGGAEGNANFSAVVVEASVTTDAEAERFEEFVGELERRCPVTQPFKRSGLDYSSTWKPLPLGS